MKDLVIEYSGEKKPFRKLRTYTILQSWKDPNTGHEEYRHFRIRNIKQRRNNKRGTIRLRAEVIGIEQSSR
jgi:hypothetical protein